MLLNRVRIRSHWPVTNMIVTMMMPRQSIMMKPSLMRVMMRVRFSLRHGSRWSSYQVQKNLNQRGSNYKNSPTRQSFRVSHRHKMGNIGISRRHGLYCMQIVCTYNVHTICFLSVAYQCNDITKAELFLSLVTFDTSQIPQNPVIIRALK